MSDLPPPQRTCFDSQLILCGGDQNKWPVSHRPWSCIDDLPIVRTEVHSYGIGRPYESGILI